MDALEFFMERRRMCNSYSDCEGCPLEGAECVVRDMTSEDNCERIVTAVEQWSKEHPRKTRQSVFLEQYPNARIDSQAVIYVCPADAYGDKVCPKNEENFNMRCYDCRHEFWGQEVE